MRVAWGVRDPTRLQTFVAPEEFAALRPGPPRRDNARATADWEAQNDLFAIGGPEISSSLRTQRRESVTWILQIIRRTVFAWSGRCRGPTGSYRATQYRALPDSKPSRKGQSGKCCFACWPTKRPNWAPSTRPENRKREPSRSSLPFAPVRRMHVYPLLGFRVDPAPQNTATRKHKRVYAVIGDDS